MYLLVESCFFVMGILMLTLPPLFYHLTQKTKTNSSKKSPPSYLFGTRFAGIMFLLVAIGLFAAHYIA